MCVFGIVPDQYRELIMGKHHRPGVVEGHVPYGAGRAGSYTGARDLRL
jgi:hypothetical protein